MSRFWHRRQRAKRTAKRLSTVKFVTGGKVTFTIKNVSFYDEGDNSSFVHYDEKADVADALEYVRAKVRK